jgi:hypothetical protein
VEWFNTTWDKLSIIETDVYHDLGGEFVYYISYGSNKQWVFLRDDRRDSFFCEKTLWNRFRSIADMDYNEAQCIMKILIDSALNNDSTGVINNHGWANTTPIPWFQEINIVLQKYD